MVPRDGFCVLDDILGRMDIHNIVKTSSCEVSSCMLFILLAVVGRGFTAAAGDSHGHSAATLTCGVINIEPEVPGRNQAVYLGDMAVDS